MIRRPCASVGSATTHDPKFRETPKFEMSYFFHKC